jgi:hypothetical protein
VPVEKSAFQQPVTPAMAFAEGEPEPAVVELNERAYKEMTQYRGLVVLLIPLRLFVILLTSISPIRVTTSIHLKF